MFTLYIVHLKYFHNTFGALNVLETLTKLFTDARTDMATTPPNPLGGR